VSAGDLVKLSETVIAIEGFDTAAPAEGRRLPEDELLDTIVLRSASELLAAAERESAGGSSS